MISFSGVSKSTGYNSPKTPAPTFCAISEREKPAKDEPITLTRTAKLPSGRFSFAQSTIRSIIFSGSTTSLRSALQSTSSTNADLLSRLRATSSVEVVTTTLG